MEVRPEAISDDFHHNILAQPVILPFPFLFLLSFSPFFLLPNFLQGAFSLIGGGRGRTATATPRDGMLPRRGRGSRCGDLKGVELQGDSEQNEKVFVPE